MPIPWPGWNTSAWHEETTKPELTGIQHYWYGSLSVGMRDASGQMYMRNRYYNPQSGQFTQPDPIGLAGGMNVYGFAAGDPVSYSDPYGLCPGKPGCPEPGTYTAEQLQRVSGEGRLDRFMNYAEAGASFTIGNASRSVTRNSGSGAVEVGDATTVNVPSIGASLDIGFNRAAPPGTSQFSIDIGIGKHAGMSVNYYVDNNGDPQKRGVTLHVGGSTPTLPVSVSTPMRTRGMAPRGSVRQEQRRLQESGVLYRVYE